MGGKRFGSNGKLGFKGYAYTTSAQSWSKSDYKKPINIDILKNFIYLGSLIKN